VAVTGVEALATLLPDQLVDGGLLA